MSAISPETSSRIPNEIWLNIITHLRNPLPRYDDPEVTWKELHQHDLTSMMRVSKVILNVIKRVALITQSMYFLAVPVLYKEAVVKDISAFLEGIASPVLPHHRECFSTVSNPPERDENDEPFSDAAAKVETTEPTPTSPTAAVLVQIDDPATPRRGLYHKQELLRMVEALHHVVLKGGERLPTHVPGSTAEILRRLPSDFLVVPNLLRTSIGSWLSPEWRYRLPWMGLEFSHVGVYRRLLKMSQADLSTANRPGFTQHICRSGPSLDSVKHHHVRSKHGSTTPQNISHDDTGLIVGPSEMPYACDVVYRSLVPGAANAW